MKKVFKYYGFYKPNIKWHKLLLTMRITFFLFFAGMISIIASPGYSQNTRISINMQDATVESVLNKIEDLSEYYFLFNQKLIDVERKVSIKAKDEPIKDILSELFPKDVKFIVSDRQIVLTPVVESSKLEDILQQQQQRRVTGVVRDENGNPLAGATVQVEGTSIGTLTDTDGKFSIEIPNESASLNISFVGYESQKMPVAGKITIEITLNLAVESLDEVVVIGYGTQKRRDVSGSVASVSKDVISSRPAARLEQALAGSIAGLDIRMTSSQPGAESKMLMRGKRSFQASNDPLLIVDGIPFYGDLNDISPYDVQSVDVLKDASSTAIYGSRGANGVIIITTKRGQINKPTFIWDSYAGPELKFGRIPLANAQQYAQWAREAYRTMGGYPDQATPDPEWDAKIFDPIELETIRSGGPGIDYLELLTQNGFQQKHQLSVNGGTDHVKYNFSGNYFEQEGIVPDDIFTRITLSTNIDVNLSRKVTSGISLQTGKTQQTRKTAREANWGGAYQRAVNATPLGRLKTPEGEDEWVLMSDALEYNPFTDYIWDCYRFRENNWNALINAYADFKIFPSLTYRISFGTTLRFNKSQEFAGYKSLVRHGGAPSAYKNDGNSTFVIYESILTYNKTFNDAHSLTITAVHGIQTYSNETSSINVLDLPYETALYYNLGSANTITNVGSDLSEWGLLSYVGRVNYGYKSRYLLSASIRVDGASQFAPGKKWGYFPSASAAWRIIEEGFMASTKNWLSELKLRLSYGVTGNQGIKPYQVQGSLSRTTYAWSNNNAFGYKPANLANKELKWESTAVTNLGLDFGMLKGRISGNIDIYNTNTFDLLMYRKLPIHTGFDQVLDNVGKTNNKGLEISLHTVNHTIKNTSRGGFLWTSDFSFMTNRTRIVELYKGKEDDPGSGWFIGYPLDVYYDFEKIGIWQLDEAEEALSYGEYPGYIKIKDQNGDGKHNDADRVILGDNEPDFIANLSNNFTFRNWDFGFTAYVRWGGMTSVELFAPYAKKRYNKIIFDYWTPENPTNAYPRPNQLYEGSGLYGSTLTYRDASQIYISQINLGYSLPQQFINKLKVTKARVYTLAQNPFYWTKSELSKFHMKADFSGTTVPTWHATRTIVLGVTLTF
ncbi:MAG TPA: TonB-dependent receptor [Bacteroidales bacterium]|nr:TonB-dependent receptor [Bacteroidales bacterium]HCI54535.1 SusC/RagA family TonB-linked outer membrane protein [Bacteroidales bacterium]HOU96876.1 TonB-dependent receptor [Bacteroidales bacterium]HQJ20541.1 TonB-dependent receptor [Bacteroidales bacterium]